MLKIIVPGTEMFNDETQKFIIQNETVLELEHSLVSLSQWESKWEKSFLASSAEKTDEETLDYIRAMTLTSEIPLEVYSRLSNENLNEIYHYIEAKMTATTFHNLPAKTAGRENVTAEVIYSWMIAINVPWEAQYWHLSRLFTVIKVMNAMNAPKKKMSPREAMSQQRALNAQRREAMKSSG